MIYSDSKFLYFGTIKYDVFIKNHSPPLKNLSLHFCWKFFKIFFFGGGGYLLREKIQKGLKLAT